MYENPAVRNTSARLAYAQSFYAALAGRTAAAAERGAEAARPVDPTVLAFQLWMNYNGYETPVTGRRSGAFFAKLREFVDDMEVC